jgi:hypothetical protein
MPPFNGVERIDSSPTGAKVRSVAKGHNQTTQWKLVTQTIALLQSSR